MACIPSNGSADGPLTAVSKPAWLFLQANQNHLDCTCLVDELSGGKFVLVNEAVNLGIAIYYNVGQAPNLTWDEPWNEL